MRNLRLVLILFLFTSISASAILVGNKPEEEKYPDVPPKKLYDRVWTIIQNDYVDKTYNYQNWEIWRHRYDDYLKTREDSYKAIETMIASLGDRYTRFLDRKALPALRRSKSLNMPVMARRQCFSISRPRQGFFKLA